MANKIPSPTGAQEEKVNEETPIPCIYGFEETFQIIANSMKHKYNKASDHPFYQILLNFHFSNLSKLKYSSKYENDIKSEGTGKYEKDVSQKNNCNLIFCEYIDDICKTRSLKEYQQILKFLLIFHDFFNEYGYKIKFPEGSKENFPNNFCDIYQADLLPESCNEFVMNYVIKLQGSVLNQMECIDLIQDFCRWLYEKKYTNLTISLF